jgi:hypothetical protein
MEKCWAVFGPKLSGHHADLNYREPDDLVATALQSHTKTNIWLVTNLQNIGEDRVNWTTS